MDLRITGAVDTAEVTTLVAEAHCDVGITDLEVEYPGLHAVELGATELVAVLPPGTRLSRPGDGAVAALHASDLNARTLVTMADGNLTRTLTDRIYEQLDVQPPRIVTTQRDALVPLSLCGFGVTFVPGRLARAAEEKGAVLARPAKSVGRRFGLVYRSEDLTPALGAFIRLALRLETWSELS